jgi:hypothetical protein
MWLRPPPHVTPFHLQKWTLVFHALRAPVGSFVSNASLEFEQREQVCIIGAEFHTVRLAKAWDWHGVRTSDSTLIYWDLSYLLVLL